MFKGMFQHIVKLLTLKHDGKGLASPIQTSIFFMVVLLTLKMLYLALWVETDDMILSVTLTIVINIVFFLIAKKVLLSEQLNGALLISIGAGALRLIFGSMPFVLLLILIIELVAIVKIINKLKK